MLCHAGRLVHTSHVVLCSGAQLSWGCGRTAHLLWGTGAQKGSTISPYRFGRRLAGLQLSDDEIDELQPKAPKKWWQAWWWCLISVSASLLVFCGGVVLRINLDESVSRCLIVVHICLACLQPHCGGSLWHHSVLCLCAMPRSVSSMPAAADLCAKGSTGGGCSAQAEQVSEVSCGCQRR